LTPPGLQKGSGYSARESSSNDRGRIPADIVAQYEAENGK
jgi:hypothetical protein